MPRHALVAGLLLLVGCRQVPTAPPPFLIGTILSRAARVYGVQTSAGLRLDSVPQMFVQDLAAAQTADCGGAAYFGLAAVRRVWYADGRAADTSALAVGAQVRVWSTGIVLESCPPQAGADEVQIDRPAPPR